LNFMDDLAIRLISSLGVPGLVTFLIYRLLDKWAAKFLEIHDRQATAITDLAGAVKAQQSGQNDVLLAVRVLSGKVEESVGWVKEISEHIKGKSGDSAS
jgi:hypothetical protein